MIYMASILLGVDAICIVYLIFTMLKNQYRSRCSCGWVGKWHYFKFRARIEGDYHSLDATEIILKSLNYQEVESNAR